VHAIALVLMAAASWRVTETSDSGLLPSADQRNGRYVPLVFLAPLSLGGALLLAMFFSFVASVVFLAALFLPPFCGAAVPAASTLSVPGAGATIVSSPDSHRTRTSDLVTAVTRPSRSGPFIDDRRIWSPTSTWWTMLGYDACCKWNGFALHGGHAHQSPKVLGTSPDPARKNPRQRPH